MSQLISLIGKIFNDCGADAKALFNHEGLACEALVLNSGEWRRGTIKLCLQFHPDQSLTSSETPGNLDDQLESPLDEIYRLMTDER